MIAGNHDSGDRIESIAALADRNRALIRGPLSADEYPLVINDAHGPVAFSALPFGNEFSARECFGDTGISNPTDVLAAQINAARKHIPKGARWVVTAHAFVTNASPSESERRLIVGGIETVPAEVFDGAHYVALGHLHRPQNAGADHIRYSGSPLAFGFDEADAEKSMMLIDLGPDGSVLTTPLPFKPLRSVRTVKGRHADLFAAASATPSGDFFKIVLTDNSALIDPMGKIREFYPNAMVLTYEHDSEGRKTKLATVAQSALNSPQHVIEEFLKFVRGETVISDEQPIIDDALTFLAQGEPQS
jgi:exonuclease SbcD